MESQKTIDDAADDRDADRRQVELVDLRNRLKAMVHWRDCLAAQMAIADAEIAADARTFATLSGDFVKPTLDQLRRMLFDKKPAA
jgi:hypothetical protein